MFTIETAVEAVEATTCPEGLQEVMSQTLVWINLHKSCARVVVRKDLPRLTKAHLDDLVQSLVDFEHEELAKLLKKLKVDYRGRSFFDRAMVAHIQPVKGKHEDHVLMPTTLKRGESWQVYNTRHTCLGE